jgi:hypothetical protein
MRLVLALATLVFGSVLGESGALGQVAFSGWPNQWNSNREGTLEARKAATSHVGPGERQRS